MVTPFPESERHITANTATIRNRLVAEMAAAVVVAHAAPGSKMEALCHDILAAAKPLYTFDHSANSGLLSAGARPISLLDTATLTAHCARQGNTPSSPVGHLMYCSHGVIGKETDL